MKVEGQQQSWPINHIEPDSEPGYWKVWLRGWKYHLTRTSDELVAAGITPPRPPIVVTSGERSIELDPDDVALFVRNWIDCDPMWASSRVAVAIANLLAPTEEQA